MSDEEADSNSVSPVLKADWFNSRWGREDQRGNGNLVTPDKVLEAVKLIKTGEIVSLGMPYDARMPIAPGRAYALRMPGGPTGGPYGAKSKTIWNDEFIVTEIGQIGTQMMRWAISAACAGCAATRPTCCSITVIAFQKCGRLTGSKSSGLKTPGPSSPAESCSTSRA
jgi:hypothetical protein